MSQEKPATHLQAQREIVRALRGHLCAAPIMQPAVAYPADDGDGNNFLDLSLFAANKVVIQNLDGTNFVYARLFHAGDCSQAQYVHGKVYTDAIMFRAVATGAAGTGYLVNLTNPGAPSSALRIIETAAKLTVYLETNAGSAIVTVPADIVAAIGKADMSDWTYASVLIGGSVEPGIVQYDAVSSGIYGNDITVFHQTGAAEAISVTGKAITITLETGVSTAESVVALVAGSTAASALVTATVDTSGIIDAEAGAIPLAGGIGSRYVTAHASGTGVVTALGNTPLADGYDYGSTARGIEITRATGVWEKKLMIAKKSSLEICTREDIIGISLLSDTGVCQVQILAFE